MTWHTSNTTPARLAGLIADIRSQGGTIASCYRGTTELIVTWFTLTPREV